MAIFVELADIILIFFFEIYKNVLKRGYYLEFVSAIKQAVMLVLVSSLYLITIKAGNDFSRIILFLMGGIYVILTYVVRIIWKQYLKNRMKAGGGDRSLIVIATSKNAEEIIQNIIEKNYEMFRISGIIIWDKDMSGKSIDGIPVVANIENAAQFLCQEWVDEVLINLDKMYPYLLELIEQCMEMGITLHLNLEKIGACIGGKQIVEEIGGYTVLTTSINTMTMKQAFIKRTSDIFFGMAGCIATGLIAVFIGPIIYISSPGPIFFSQERVGKNGKRFKLYKFRSMYMDAEERKAELMKDNKLGDGKMFKLDFDPRVIGN
ncbi:MAG: sugar transferase, partial [Muricoprocola sp.]